MDELGPWEGARGRLPWRDIGECVLALAFLCSGAAAVGFLYVGLALAARLGP